MGFFEAFNKAWVLGEVPLGGVGWLAIKQAPTSHGFTKSDFLLDENLKLCETLVVSGGGVGGLDSFGILLWKGLLLTENPETAGPKPPIYQ